MNFGALISTLETELGVYKKFEEIEGEKTAVIIEGEIEKLDGILNVEQMLQMKLQDVEKKRINSMRTLGLGEKTLAAVIELADGEEKKKLSGLLEDLNICIDALKLINERNTKLVMARLDVISSVTKLFKEPGAGAKGSGNEKIYGKNAKVLDSSKEFEPSVIHKKI